MDQSESDAPKESTLALTQAQLDEAHARIVADSATNGLTIGDPLIVANEQASDPATMSKPLLVDSESGQQGISEEERLRISFTQTHESGQQGRSNSSRENPFKPTSEIRNSDGQMIAYDLLEESSRAIGIPATAAKYAVNVVALRSRARDHKWKKIPDGRTLAKRNKETGGELATEPGDFSTRIAPYRERVFKKMDDSLGKFRPKAPKSFKEFDSASKIAERMMGIGDQAPSTAILVHINEAIDEHGEDMQPIEAHEIPCSPDSLDSGIPEAGQQRAIEHAPIESDAPAESA